MELIKKNIEEIRHSLFHVSLKQNRQSIMEHGLLPNIGEGYAQYWLNNFPGESMIPAVFLCEKKFGYSGHEKTRYDVYRIWTGFLDYSKLFIDPAWILNGKIVRPTAYIYFGHIAPEFIERIN